MRGLSEASEETQRLLLQQLKGQCQDEIPSGGVAGAQRRSGWVQPLTLHTGPTPSLRATPPEGITSGGGLLVIAVI
ncbi:MAG: hypothetical protein AAFP07_21920 [Cyanobacteria bacterium J06606_4]